MASVDGRAVTLCAADECENAVGAYRSDARYCSSACRQREYRLRKRLLAPWGGDAEVALAYLLAHTPGAAFEERYGYIRNGEGDDDE